VAVPEELDACARVTSAITRKVPTQNMAGKALQTMGLDQICGEDMSGEEEDRHKRLPFPPTERGKTLPTGNVFRKEKFEDSHKSKYRKISGDNVTETKRHI
jgi:hypothetical protein